MVLTLYDYVPFRLFECCDHYPANSSSYFKASLICDPVHKLERLRFPAPCPASACFRISSLKLVFVLVSEEADNHTSQVKKEEAAYDAPSSSKSLAELLS